MRRALTSLLVLTLLGASGLVYAHRVVNASRDTVEIYETVLCGDSSAAQGLMMRAPVYAGGHLFWDTEFEPGSDRAPETEFRFSPQQEYPDRQRNYGGVYVNLMMNMGASGNYGTEFDFENTYYGGHENGFYRVYGDILKEAASRTAPGQEHTERVELTDWINYVPFQFDFDLPGFVYKYDDGDTHIETSRGSTEDLGAILAEYFRIPLTGSCPVDISVTRDINGELVEWQVSGVSGVETANYAYDSENVAAVSTVDWEDLYINSYSVVTEDACYFVLERWDRETGRIDFSTLPGGRGVYRLPFEYEDENGEIMRMCFDNIEAVLPVADDEYVELLDTDGERLLMITVGNGKLYFTQGKLPELTEVKKTALTDLVELDGDWYDGYRRVGCSGGLYYIETTGGRVLLLESVNGGDYEVRLNVPAGITDAEESMESLFDAHNLRLNYDYYSGMSWNGERLAVARWFFKSDSGYYDANPNPVLWVYDEKGLLYCGYYESSLVLAPGAELYSDCIRASGDLELSWK